MRVMGLTSWYPPHHFGGYELSCQDVMRRLATRGHHVEVLTSDHRHDDADDGDPAPVAHVDRSLRLYFRHGDLWSPAPTTRLRIERHNQRALTAALERCQPDVVSVWHVGAMSLGLLTTLRQRGIPVVLAVSDEWPIYAHRLDPWTRATTRVPRAARWFQRLTGLPAGHPHLDDIGPACFISERTRQRCQDKSPWDFPRNGLVYSGIDYPLFHTDLAEAPTPTGATFGANGTPLRLLYVGRIDERKGIRTLLSALRQLPSSRLTIDARAAPADARALDDWCREAGVADRVHPVTSSREQLADRYRSAHICVFPSEWPEPFGLVPLEAMAAGTPVVATGVGGSGEFLVDGENCVLFEAGSPTALADAIRRLSDSPQLVRHIVRTGQTTAAHFDSEHLADAFDAWHRAAIDGPDATLPGDRQPPKLR